MIIIVNPAKNRVNEMLSKAVDLQASDIHFQPNVVNQNVMVYFRINGIRTFFKQISFNEYQLVLTYCKFSSNMDIGEIRKPQHGSIHLKILGTEYSLRLATLPLEACESLSIRLLPQTETAIPDELFLFKQQFNRLKTWIYKDAGLILATGPTGSGKSTAIYSLLEERLQEQSVQIVTIEDPVERRIDGLLQVEVNEQAGITYHTGLKAALRHDPDILMIGEIRDEKTAEIAVRAALTGHLVISTLHAKNSISTLDRLVELGINRLHLQQTLIAIIALELIVLKRKGREKRAAIAEILDGALLEQLIKGDESVTLNHSFHHLKRKAYAYGFISNIETE